MNNTEITTEQHDPSGRECALAGRKFYQDPDTTGFCHPCFDTLVAQQIHAEATEAEARKFMRRLSRPVGR